MPGRCCTSRSPLVLAASEFPRVTAFGGTEIRIKTTPQTSVEDWNPLVARLNGGYFQCCAEVSCHASAPGACQLLAEGYDRRGCCIGVVTGVIVRSRIWPFSRFCGYAMLLSLPAMAPGFEDKQTAFMLALEQFLRKQGVFSIRVYSYDSPGSDTTLTALGYSLSERHEFIVDLDRPLEEIWARLQGTRRTDIRKAERLGVETRRQNTIEGLEMLLSFQSRSMARRGIKRPETAEPNIRAQRERLSSGNVDVFVSYLAGAPMNAALFGVFNNRPYYHVSGSSDEGYKCCGPAHLLWTAIKDYRSQGARRLNLGAVVSRQDGLHRFKKDFGAEVFPAPIGVKRVSRIGSLLHLARSTIRP